MNLILRVKGQTTPKDASRMTVVECLDTKKDSGRRDIVIAIKATIFRMKIDQKIWYNACKRCGKTVRIHASDNYCQLCGISDPRTHPRYIICIVVIDHTGTLNVVIFDRDVEKIVDTSEHDLSLLITSEIGNEVIEQKVQRPFWKFHIFHIKASQIKDVKQPYPVTRICDINYGAESG